MKFFRFFLSFSLIALFIHVLGACESDEVVNCFSSVIGKWLESLWHSSKDIEILTWETCEYQAIMQVCKSRLLIEL